MISEKVFLVDENPQILQGMSDCLRSNGYETYSSSSAQQAFALLESGILPDLMLVGTSLPDMSGFEFCSRVAERPALAGVYLVIALEDQKLDKGSLEQKYAEVNDVLVRPITDQGFLVRIRAMLRQHQLGAAVRQKEETLHLRGEEMDALRIIAQQIRQELPLDEILGRVMDEVARVVRADHVFIFITEGEGLRLRAGKDFTGHKLAQRLSWHDAGQHLCGRVVREKSPSYLKHVSADDCPMEEIQSVAMLPLQMGDEIIGVLGAASEVERDFEQQSAFLQTLAVHLSLDIQNLRLHEQAQSELAQQIKLDHTLEEKNKLLAALQETSMELISEHDLQTLLEHIVQRASDLVKADGGALDMIDASGKRLIPAVGIGSLKNSLAYECKLGEGLMGSVWEKAQALVVDHYNDLPGRVGAFSEGQVGSVLGVPLISNGKVLGVLGLAYQVSTRRSFGEGEIDLLGQFARLAAIAVENARLVASLQNELAERERTETALRASESRARDIFSTIPDSISINDENGVYLDINEGFTRQSGYTREDVIGKSTKEINVWVDLDQRNTFLKELWVTGLLESREAKFRMKDGHIIDALASARLVTLNNTRCVLTLVHDITDKKEMEDALKSSERKFRSIMEASPAGMFIFRLVDAGRLELVELNPAAERIFGLKVETVRGEDLDRVIFIGSDPAYLEICWQVASGNVGPQTFEIDYRTEQVSCFFEVHIYQPEKGLVLIEFFDISRRKEIEQNLKDREFWLSESQRVGRIGSYDLDIAKEVWVGSDGLDEVFGMAADAEKTLASWNNLVHPDERQAMLDYFVYFVVGERQPFDKEYRIVRASTGEVRWVWGHGQLTFDENGVPLRMIGTIQDITERKLAEEEVRILNVQLEDRVAERTKQLEVSNHELEAFAYSVSHDLRAPLRGIDGWSQALLDDCNEQLDADGKMYLGRVRRETARMGKLIDDLLMLSRLTRSEMKFAHVDLSALAAEVFERLREPLGNRQVDFVLQQGMQAEGDSHLLEIALTNLLGNALKFTSTRPLARLEFGRELQKGKLVYFVRDNGVGFDMKYASKLFGAFQRMHHQDEFPGTGIGLATVQRIIHRHGGLIWADAQPDVGATFYFTLSM